MNWKVLLIFFFLGVYLRAVKLVSSKLVKNQAGGKLLDTDLMYGA